MFSVMIYMDMGKGEYLHPKSGTYNVAPLQDLIAWLQAVNFTRMEIIPSY